MAITLGYWNIRALGHLPRLLLDMAGQDWSLVKHDIKNQASWFSEEKKENCHGLTVPNLPYLITDDIKLTQSDAIVMYITEKMLPQLLPKVLEDRALGCMWKGIMGDVRRAITNIVLYDKMDAAVRKQKFEAFVESFDDKYGQAIDGQLSKHHFLLGSELTLYDLYMLDVLELLEYLDERMMSETSKGYLARVRAVDTVSKFYSGNHCVSDFFYKSPL
ncbi:MAG: hypothetical protein KVP17_002691 [Porospora cf. gigantea B]|uniref:uncharacterized protein n=2 Tax=Porospora cf. gigantea B TaxID=2853592 RepID=UPI0035719ACA|nr:MAG: hypothetical protein KVP17_002683 [Porospora cf. gigantea B]KAH0485373.1 MAG: hypothetical protein KVP17_002691 [Porospora cf. gigantea B]